MWYYMPPPEGSKSRSHRFIISNQYRHIRNGPVGTFNGRQYTAQCRLFTQLTYDVTCIAGGSQNKRLVILDAGCILTTFYTFDNYQ